MRRFVMTLLLAVFCLVVGLGLGICFGPQLQQSEPAQWIATNAPWATSMIQPDRNGPFESYAYPTIKWRPKLVAGAPGAIAQLSTTYDSGARTNQPGIMKYRLTLFKAPGMRQCEVQLLDDMGFKLTQFNVSTFREVSGAPDIMEARDSLPCSEDDYKKAREYSIN